ncbi:MAG: cation:proton antiporter [Acidimicrobiales bacterium]
MFLAVAPPDHHVVLVFLCEVLVLLVVARLLGWVMGRIGQPAVVGELLAGVVLGPSLLGRVWPTGQEWLFPEDAAQGAMLFGLAWIGLLLLLAATGFESDLAVIRRLGRSAVTVTIGSLALPIAGGYLLAGRLMP